VERVTAADVCFTFGNMLLHRVRRHTRDGYVASQEDTSTPASVVGMYIK